MQWYALYTKPKFEQKVVSSLELIDIEVYCPMVKEVKQWSDRKKKITRPLIPSYVFVKLNENERNKVFEINGTVRYLFWLGKPAIVKQSEIEAMKSFLKNSVTEVTIKGYKKGDVIELNQGPFKGKSGRIHHLNGNNVQLLLEGMGFLITLTFE